MTERRRGVRIGVDVGTVRVGIAVSDPDGVLATPLATLRRDPDGNSDVVEAARLVAEREAVEVVVGDPRHLSGAAGASSALARDWADMLAARIAPVPVRLVDERLSTVVADRALAGRGVRAKARRQVVDAAAAVVILQSALDAERR